MFNRIKKYSFFVIILVGILAYYLSPLIIDDDIVLWAFAHLILNAVVLHYHLNYFKEREQEAFPVIPILVLYNSINFTFSIFYVAPDEYQLSPVSVEALMYSFFAFLLFYLTFYSFLSFFLNSNKFHYFDENDKLVEPFIFVISIISIIGLFTDLGIPVLFDTSSLIVIGMILYKLVEKIRINYFQLIIFAIFLYRELVFRTTSGLIYLIVIFFLYCFFVIQLSTKKIRKNLISSIFLYSGVFFYLIFSPIKDEYRKISYDPDFEKKSTSTDKLNLILDLYNVDRSNVVNYESKERKRANENPFWRFSYQPSAISMVMDKTPSEVPYWGGITYLPFFIKFIPRIFWPDKPIENMGQQFGHTYHKLRDDDTVTSLNNPILAEMYMNFGIWGMMIGSIILGFAFIVIAKIFNQSSTNPFDNILNITFLLNLFIWESNASQVLGIFIIYYILFLLIFKIIKSFV